MISSIFRFYKFVILILCCIISLWNTTFADEYNDNTPWAQWLPLHISFEKLNSNHFINSFTGVMRLWNSLQPTDVFFTEEQTIKYNSPSGTIAFWYVVLKTWIFPAWFWGETKQFRENYFINNVCKNTTYDIDYQISADKTFTISPDILEWTFAWSNKAFILCAKNNSGKYGAYGMSYNLKKELTIWLPWNTGYSKNELFNSENPYNISLKLNYISNTAPSKKIRYYVAENSNACSDNISNYTEVLNYDQVTIDGWQMVTYTPNSDGEKKITVCLWVFHGWNNSLLYKEEKKGYFQYDNSKPEVKMNENWENDTWYTTNKNITITCEDTNLVSCTISYAGIIIEANTNSGITNGKATLSLPLNKNWENILKITAIDELNQTTSLEKVFKLVSSGPSVRVFFEEVSENYIISKIKAQVICEDQFSWCTNTNITWWDKIADNIYEKWYSANTTDTIILRSNAGKETSQSINIFNIGSSMIKWYWVAYSNEPYEQRVAPAWVNPCWVASSCKQTNTDDLCFEFQANINPVSNNGYDVYLDGVDRKYKANHRFASEYLAGIPAGMMRCQYYDAQPPKFDVKNEIIVANDKSLVYTFNWLEENGWSWLNEIKIEYTLENGNKNTLTYNVTQKSQEDALKNKTLWVDLWLNYKNVLDFDEENKWYGKISLHIEISDWVGNKTIKEDSLYIVPGQINIPKSFTIEKKWEIKDEKVVADGSSHYQFTIDVKDIYENKIKPYKIHGLEEREIRSLTGIIFENTSNFLDVFAANNPIYFRWPGQTSWSSWGNVFSWVWLNTYFTNGLPIIFYVKSVVPTLESDYDFWRWDVHLKDFSVSDSKFWNSNFSANADFSQKLKFWPAFEVEITEFTNTINDNTNYNLKIQVTRNTDSPIKFEPSVIKFHFNFSNIWGLWKRIKVWNEENFSNNWGIDIDIGVTPPWSKWSSSQTYTLNFDSNGLGFWDSSIDLSLIHPYSKFNNINTSYQVTKYNIWKDTFLNRDIDIRWLISSSSQSVWSSLMENTTPNVSLDKNGFDKWVLKAEIKKNIETYTKNLTNTVTTNTDYTIDLTKPTHTLPSWEKIFYYDFSWKTCSNNYNSLNQWCLVKVSWDIIGISGKNNIIVKWWNLLLDTDMYYQTNNSLIWYYVLRDEKNQKNGGNIYITQKPTNIVWILFSEWSIMSVDSNNPTKIFINNNTSPTELNKQLMWYGSIFAANTIWWSVDYYNTSDKKLACPYGTDIYIDKKWVIWSWCTFDEANKYDFAALRRFSTRQWNETIWCNNSYYGVNGNGAITPNAFAWRKTCFNEAGNALLQKIDNHTSSLIIKYDVNAQQNALIILSK